jgi:two-component system CheB/CheR fusion protein
MPTNKKKTPLEKIATFQKVSQKKKPKPGDFLIVGIGASAGGLETLEAFFHKMPPGFRALPL